MKEGLKRAATLSQISPLNLTKGERTYQVCIHTYFEIISATNWLRTCACSLGGPGRKRDEHRGGKSTLGTKLKRSEKKK